MHEFQHVVHHQHQTFAACVACNVLVTYTNGLAEFFQGGNYGAVVLRGLGAVGEQFQAAAWVGPG